MSIIIDRDVCTACEACLEVCPFDAVEIVDDAARVNENCNLCGACEDACPEGAIVISKKEARLDHEYRGVMVFAEQRRGRLAEVGLELLGEGRRLADQLGVELTAVLFGHGIAGEADRLIGQGADRVLIADHPGLEHFTDDLYGGLLARLIQAHKPEVVLCGATSMGRSFFPKTARAVDTGLTADCTGLEVRPEDRLLVQTRPAFGGAIMAAILCPQRRPQMATVRPKVMKPLAFDPNRRGEKVMVDVAAENLASRTRVLEAVEEIAENVNLAEAEVIVAGGRGLGKPEGFDLLRRLADRLNGVIGATRGAVDAGWIPYAHQVGQTGKTVAPKLYIACGISGAVQHQVGMQSSDVVVAVNSDPNAPIFDAADYALIGDVYEIVPAMIRRLDAG